MVLFVIITNVILGLICLRLAQTLWALKLKFTKIAGSTLAVEQYFYRLLYNAPTKLDKATLSVNRKFKSFCHSLVWGSPFGGGMFLIRLQELEVGSRGQGSAVRDQ